MSEQVKGGGAIPSLAEADLRDYFAAKAMQGLASACDSEGMWTGEGFSTAEQAYAMADAMLIARDTDTTER